MTSRHDGEVLESGNRTADPWTGVDGAALVRAVRAQAERPVAGIDDMASYLADQVSDTPRGRRVVSRRWIAESWTPCRVRSDYGLSWWLNDEGTVRPRAPRTGRCARGNGGSHLLWVDPARDLVIASRWGAQVERLLTEVSAAISTR